MFTARLGVCARAREREARAAVDEQLCTTAMSRIADAVAVAWLAASLALGAGTAQALWGDEEVGSFPRWRCVLVVPVQAVLLPISWLVARPLRAARTETSRVGERLFHAFFCGYLLLDAYWCPAMPLKFAAHHVACLSAHALVARLFAPGMGVYFSGVVALEIGSAACNYWFMYPTAASRLAYDVLMLASNVAASWFCWRGVTTHGSKHRSANVTMGLITLGIVGNRQWASVQYYL